MGRLTLAVAIALVCGAMSTHAQELPHTFEGGDRILADEVNANFEYLERLHDKGYAVHADGKLIGYAVDHPGMSDRISLTLTNGAKVRIYRDGNGDGRILIQEVYWRLRGCVETPYIKASAYGYVPDELILADVDGILYYVAPNTETVFRFEPLSHITRIDHDLCVSKQMGEIGEKVGFELLLNDPAVTGIENQDYPFRNITIDGMLPLIIDRP